MNMFKNVQDVLIPGRVNIGHMRFGNNFFEQAFNDSNILMTAITWPELGVSENDYNYIRERLCGEAASFFRDEVDIRSRIAAYAVIALAIRGDNNVISIQNRMKNLGYNKELSLFQKNGIIEIKKTKITIDKEKSEKGIILTADGVNLLNNIAEKVGVTPGQLDTRLDQEITMKFFDSLYDEVIKRELIYFKTDKYLKEREKTIEKLTILFFDNNTNSLKKKDWFIMCKKRKLIDSNISESDVDTKQLKKIFRSNVLFDISNYRDWPMLRRASIILGIEENYEQLEKALINIRDITPMNVDLRRLECRRFLDLNRLLSHHKAIDSQAYFNALREGLIKFTEVNDVDGEESAVIIGPRASEFLTSPLFKYDWLDMGPKVRRIFSENGICPLGIENKERCERTWKCGSSIDKILHKDVNGIRVEVSNTYQKIFFWPRKGRKISYDDLQEICIDMEIISEDYNLIKPGVRARKTELGFSFDCHNDYVRLNHNESKYITLAYLKKIVQERVECE